MMNTKNVHKEEIDFFSIILYLLSNKKPIILTSFISALLGLIISLTTTVEYQSKTVFIVQQDQEMMAMKGLSGIASMAGINLGANSSSQLIPTSLYKNIVESVPFKKSLMNSYITYKTDSITLYDYFSAHKKESILGNVLKYTIKLPFTIVASFKDKDNNTTYDIVNSDFPTLTVKEKNISRQINTQLNLIVDDATNCITVESNFYSALMSAEVARNYVEILQNIISGYKIRKASENYNFILDRYTEQKKLVEEMQNQIAEFKDQNKNFTSAISQIKLQRLNNDFNVVHNLYGELAMQLEKAKLQIKKDTPLFIFLDPVNVPSQKNKPRKLLYIIVSFMLGFISCCTVYIVKCILKSEVVIEPSQNN